MRPFASRPTQARARILHRVCALALVAGATPSCRAPVHVPPGADNLGLVASPRLKSANPLDVVVARIENLTARADLPLEELRREFHRGLVERRYSPLALEYVDRSSDVSEAAYRVGSNDENAVLKVVITSWDDANWRTHARLVVDADVWLLDAQSPSTSEALFGGHVQRRLEMSRVREVTATESALLAKTLRQFVEDVLASLPVRNPELATKR